MTEAQNSITNHKEWLKKVGGIKVNEIENANPMVGIDGISLESLVVSSTDLDWDNIKQPIIPLEVVKSEDESAKLSARRLRMLRAQLNSENAFLALVKDEQMGGEDGWALSIINPKDLSSTEESLRGEMEACYMAGQTVLGSSTRAALIAISEKTPQFG